MDVDDAGASEYPNTGAAVSAPAAPAAPAKSRGGRPLTTQRRVLVSSTSAYKGLTITSWHSVPVPVDRLDYFRSLAPPTEGRSAQPTPRPDPAMGPGLGSPVRQASPRRPSSPAKPFKDVDTGGGGYDSDSLEVTVPTATVLENAVLSTSNGTAVSARADLQPKAHESLRPVSVAHSLVVRAVLRARSPFAGWAMLTPAAYVMRRCDDHGVLLQDRRPQYHVLFVRVVRSADHTEKALLSCTCDSSAAAELRTVGDSIVDDFSGT